MAIHPLFRWDLMGVFVDAFLSTFDKMECFVSGKPHLRA